MKTSVGLEYQGSDSEVIAQIAEHLRVALGQFSNIAGKLVSGSLPEPLRAHASGIPITNS